MSTKLHHGYRLTEGADVFSFNENLRTALNPVRDELDLRLLAESAAHQHDRALFAAEPVESSTGLWTDAYFKYTEEQHKADPRRIGHDPHRFELSLGRDPKSGRVHLLAYVDRKALQVAFEELPEVEEYGYWDNTDALEGVSAEAWQERRDSWERVLPRGATPIETMMSFALRPDCDVSFDVMTLEGAGVRAALDECLSEDLTPAARASTIARNLVCSAYDRDTFRADPMRVLNAVHRAEQTKAFASRIEPLLAPLSEAALRSPAPAPLGESAEAALAEAAVVAAELRAAA